MTRGPIPRFDLYEELEVSRLASAEVIEAAYRTLVKRHHPDVSDTNGAGDSQVDADRIKRLNVAHDWLTAPARRLRYNEATANLGPPDPATKAAGPNGRKRMGDPVPAPAPAPAMTPDAPPQSFGPNGKDVRQFLADLRPIDQARAQQILDVKATLPSTPYAEARGGALVASRTERHDQWLFARDAASVIARGKLGEWPHAGEIVAIVGDIAGAIVIRDLIPVADYDLLLQPWTRRLERVAPPVATRTPARTTSIAATTGAAIAAARTAATAMAARTVARAASRAVGAKAAARTAGRAAGNAAAAVAAKGAAAGAAGRTAAVAAANAVGQSASEAALKARAAAAAAPAGRAAGSAGVRGRRPIPLAGVAVAVVAIIGIAVLAGGLPRPELAVAGLTDNPSEPTRPVVAGIASPGASGSSAPVIGPTTDPGAGLPTSSESPAPIPTGTGPIVQPPGPTAGPGPVPTPRVTPRPTAPSTPPPTLPPTPSPTAPPTAPPTPPPTPAPTPQVDCTVANLVNVNTSNAQLTWSSAGFTGSVIFSPSPPPQYKIGWQSLTVGQVVPCTSSITVQKVAP